MTDRLRDTLPHNRPDDLDTFLAEQLDDPAFAAAYSDSQHRSKLHLRLVEARRASGLTVNQIADRMEVDPARVVEYEAGAVDPRLSFHQRYARALGARLVVEVLTGSDV